VVSLIRAVFLLVLLAAVGCGGGTSINTSNPLAPTLQFSAQPATISTGGSATLSWTTNNATSVNIPGVGTFGASGSTVVTPAATTTYTATATGPNGTASSMVTVSIQSGSTSGSVPPFNHVFLVVEENHSYSSVIGNSLMPYLNSLATQNGLATQYFANTHPSIGNYFELTAGQTITNDDSYNSTVTADNVVRQLVAAGKTWKSYAESLPNAGYTGFDVYPYARKHNPLAFFSDVVNDPAQAANLVPFSQFAADLAANHLPQYGFIVPNLLDDAHDGTLQAADSWLQTNIGPLLSSSAFQNSLLVIVFDESDDTDTAHGGGQVACVIVSPLAKKGYQSSTLYQHPSVLRLMLEGLGVTSLPGASATAPDMGEFF
jgi:acid phosphatase